MPRAVTPHGAGRLMLVPLSIAVLGIVAAVVYQSHSTIATSRAMAIQRTATLASLIETEVSNIAHFGQFRVERLDDVFSDLVAQGIVEHVALSSQGGLVLIEAGAPVAFPESARTADAPIISGEHIFRSGEIVIRESFESAHGGAWSGASPGGPAGNPSGLITGKVRLEIVCDGHWLARLRDDTLTQLAVTLALMVAFAISFALMLRARRVSEEERHLAAMAKERAAHLEGINLMASGLAHEIKNPVGAARGFAQLLASAHPEDSEEHRHLQIMMESLDEVTERVDRLLSFAAPRPPSKRPESLFALVRKVLLLMGPDIADKDVSLETRLDEDALPLDLDAGQIREVVLNLVINALDAVGVGGSIRVETRYEPGARLHRLIVTDDGPGISPEHMEKIFAPYFTTKARGSGLGLAISRKNVENHGGTIALERGVNGGTVAVVTLPAGPKE